MPFINRALIGPLEKFRGIEAATVARAMVNEVSALARQAPAQLEVRVHEYPDIKALAAQDVAS